MRQERRKTHKKYKFYIVSISLIVIILISSLLAHNIYKNKVKEQNKWMNQLEQASDELFIDSHKDIQKSLTNEQINHLKEKLKVKEDEKLQSKNITKYRNIIKQTQQAEDMLEIQQSVEDLAANEIVKDEMDIKDIETIRKLLDNYEECFPTFYKREAEQLKIFEEQISLREEAIQRVKNLFDGEQVKENITLADRKDVVQVVKKVPSPQIRESLENDLQKVKEEILANGKFVALTFDDGPGGEATEQILKTLEKHEVKATFFMLGKNAKYFPTTAQKVADAGHEIGNHSINHPQLTRLSPGEINRQVKQAAEMIEEATGEKPVVFRPPYGSYNEAVQTALREDDEINILWSVDTLDWQSRNAQAILNEVKKQVYPGSIILMHDIHPETADAVPLVLDYLEGQGYNFATISELIELNDNVGNEVILNF